MATDVPRENHGRGRGYDETVDICAMLGCKGVRPGDDLEYLTCVDCADEIHADCFVRKGGDAEDGVLSGITHCRRFDTDETST